jgi:hypothetical protein
LNYLWLQAAGDKWCSNRSQIILHNGIPFKIKIPNDVTTKTLKDSENGKNFHHVNSVDEFFRSLILENSLNNSI